MLTQAFGISSFVFSIIAIFVPMFGVIIAGLSGILAWVSVGKASFWGMAAVIINFLNIILFSPAFILVAGLEMSQQTPEESELYTIWGIVLLIQIVAAVLFFLNFILGIFLKKRASRKLVGLSNFENQVAEDNSSVNISSNQNEIRHPPGLTKTLVKKIHGGRKQDSKFWQSEFNSKSLENIPLGEENTHKDIIRANREWKKVVYGSAVVILFLFTIVFLRPDLFPFLSYAGAYNSISQFFPDKQNAIEPISKPIVKTIPVIAKQPPAVTEPEKPSEPYYVITQEMVDNAFGKVLSEKQYHSERTENIDKQYYYIIKLAMGDEIKTDNIRINSDTVSYRDPKGYKIEIDKFEISQVKRYSL